MNLKRIPKESPMNLERILMKNLERILMKNLERILMKNLERMSIRTGRVRKGILGSDGKFWRRGNAVRAAHARTHALPIKRHKRPKAPNATTR